MNYIIGPNGNFISEDELYHYGVLGMKWGVRRYQRKDGTLTEAGKKRIQEGTATFPYTKEIRSGKRHPSLTQRNRALARVEKYKWEEIEEFNKSIGDTYEDYIKNNPNYDKIFKKHLKTNFPQHAKNGYGEPYEYWQAHFQGTVPGAEKRAEIHTKWTNRFIEEYAIATLDDLNLRATSETREYAEEWVRKHWTRSG